MEIREEEQKNLITYIINLVYKVNHGRYSYQVKVFGNLSEDHLETIGLSGVEGKLSGPILKFLGLYHIAPGNNVRDLVFSDFERFVNEHLSGDEEQELEFMRAVEEFKKNF